MQLGNYAIVDLADFDLGSAAFVIDGVHLLAAMPLWWLTLSPS